MTNQSNLIVKIFIDYVLSDGRPTFSKTSIVNKTASSSNDQQSTLLIGISMPQSSESILDPDFTPLLIDKSNDSGCIKSNTWRIIVGVVVGVVGAVAIAVASIILIKKKRMILQFNKNIQHKLSRMDDRWFTVLLLLFVISISSSNNHVALSQSLPTTELNSAIWIIRQYGSDLPQDQTSICSSLYFVCSAASPTPHIIKIVMLSYPTTTTGLLPNAGLNQFDFPELVEIDIIAVQAPISPSLNILDLIKGSAPKLQKLFLRSDTSITSLPSGLGYSLPMLKSFLVENVYFQHDIVFDFGPTVTDLKFAIVGALIIDQSTPVHTNLASLNINVKLLVPQSITFTNQSFPALTSLSISPQSNSMSLIVVVTSQSEVHLYIEYPQSVMTLMASGFSTLLPSLDQFTKLSLLALSQSTLSSLPFTEYPEYFSAIQVTSTNLAAIPNIPIRNLKSITLDHNQIESVPWNNFQNANNILLDVSFNTGLATIVPESFCNNRLYIDGCPLITDLPECFKCYQNNRFYVRTDIVLDPGFTCNITFNSTMLYTVLGYGTLFGTNLGYGYYVNNRYLLTPEIPNKKLRFYDNQLETGPPRNITLVMDGNYPEYKYNITVLEIGISITQTTFVQLPTQVVQLKSLATMNPYLDHTISINDNIDCVITGLIVDGYLYCNISGHSFKQGDTLKYTISNPYYTFQQDIIVYQVFYPADVVLDTRDSIISVGSTYNFSGKYGTGPMDQTIIYFNGDPSICNVTFKNQSNIQCDQTKFWQGGETNITISVDGFTANPIMVDLKTIQSLCNDTGCSGHGSCDINGTCVCDTGYYSDKCLQKYPTFRSGSYDLNDRKLISIYGDFGPFNQTTVSITLNNTDCQVTYKSQLTVDNSTNNGNNWIYFKPSSQGSGSGSDSGSDSNELTCPFNCYGHGQCINGKCQCQPGYSSIDNCLTKTSNHTNTPNTTSPTTSFDIDGIDFQFEMIAIQEIDTDDNIINEVLTNSWNSTIIVNNQTQTTTVNYQLNNSDTTALVTATISFSQQPRDIQFGSQLLHIDAN
ncbi:hypothetical protein DFA_09555 [Cavenderia fasciculata]|uniref:EGF-like domain-containing protein n=1 Tax=Cavenderia fasciculata TaxID=261658 RepID=F4Q7Y6_CACFS|nr:uncharacterized protein DFA_09555 [Cavenderia fasciculata]EGG15886.1 hypothetical protein DFA_09555 [Cavenderia fasciculata]|eukprot:XP_004352211.1 hypothetical protein DFA_09555 [Cavenderia fasciculata]